MLSAGEKMLSEMDSSSTFNLPGKTDAKQVVTQVYIFKL